MIVYLMSEIKEAALWLRDAVMSLLKWMFRWILRLGLLSLFLFGFGGGWHFLSNTFKGEDAKQAAESVQAENTKLPTEQLERNTTQYTRESQKPPIQTQVKSTWSVLNGIVRDVERFIRRR